jgi:two-component system chemotaxis response regulator CheY
MAKYNCLIVEDSPMMRQLLVLALSRIAQLEIVEADDGLLGMKKLAAQKFDIVIVDINMPIMDGLKLIKHIRSDKLHADVPVVIVSTEGGAEDRQRATLLGVQAYITKPVSAPKVISTVKRLLKIDP